MGETACVADGVDPRLVDECLVSEFDNAFFNAEKITKQTSGAIYFYKLFADFKEARMISDHVPVFFQFTMK